MTNLAPVRAFLDPLFNGVILEGFICGMYTMVLVQAIWILYSKGRRDFYPLSLMFLWILVIINLSCAHEGSRNGFVVHSSSPVTMMRAHNTNVLMLDEIVQIMVMIISDAILIWRCNALWHNKYILAVLITLLVTTSGFLISNGLLPQSTYTLLVDSLGILSSLATTITATSLIALKIVLVTRRSHTHYSYSKIVEILIQSAALVSIVQLGGAILQLISFKHSFNLTTTSGILMYHIFEYIGYIQTPISGIAPTLIAFRISEESAQPSLKTTHMISAAYFASFHAGKDRNGTDMHSDSEEHDDEDNLEEHKVEK